MAEHPLLVLKDVHTFYGSSHVLQGVNLTLQGGAISLVGRNGMGKTTLVKTIMGLAPARAGTVLFKGDDVARLKPFEIAARGIGYVPQGRHLFPSLSVKEHLTLAARRGNGARWDADRVFALFPRLAERGKQSGAALFGGEQQMLSIGRALVTNPNLLIMDEPSEGLAPVILDHLHRNLPFAGELRGQYLDGRTEPAHRDRVVQRAVCDDVRAHRRQGERRSALIKSNPARAVPWR